MTSTVPTPAQALLKSVMTPFPYTVDRGAELAEAADRMRSHEIRHLPVKSGEELVGFVTLEAVERLLQVAPEASLDTAVHEEPYVADLNSLLADVLLEMARRHVTCVLVTRNDRLAGIFTATDACRRFGADLAARGPGGEDVA